jgi:xanthine dehydrogenase YagS FAD-binding subunit
MALGGVAHKPWRVAEAEAVLFGKPATRETFAQAAELLVKGAKTYEHNAFKVELAKQCVVKALMQASMKKA